MIIPLHEFDEQKNIFMCFEEERTYTPVVNNITVDDDTAITFGDKVYNFLYENLGDLPLNVLDYFLFSVGSDIIVCASQNDYWVIKEYI